MEYFNRLPLAVRRRFVQIARRGTDPCLIHRSSDGYAWLLLLFLAIVPMAATAPVMMAFAGIWLAVPLMAGLFGLSVGLLVAAASWLYPTHPFAAGTWAFADCVVDCRANTFNVVRFNANTVFEPRTSTTRHRTRRGSAIQTTTTYHYGVHILTRGISQLTLSTKSMGAATALAGQLDRARREFLGAWDRGDHTAVRRMSPFYEHLMGEPHRPAEAKQPPLMRPIPPPVRAIGALFVLGGAAVGAYAGYAPIAIRAKDEEAARVIAEREAYIADNAARAEELAASTAVSDQARAFLERMFDKASVSQGVLYVDFRGDVVTTGGVPAEVERLRSRSYGNLEEIMTQTLSQRIAGWTVHETDDGAGPVIWVTRHVFRSSSRHQTAEGEVVGLFMVFDAIVHWRTEEDDSAHEPLDVMMKLKITTQPPSTLPTNLSAHNTFKEMLKAQHETFAAELIYRLVKKGKAKPTKKTKKKRKKK